MGLSRSQSFWFTVYVLCISALFAQIYPLLRFLLTTNIISNMSSPRDYAYPSKTSTRREEVIMKDFPLLTRICIHPGFDITALREAGYLSVDNYFSGRSRFNSSMLVGWAGHTKDGKVIGKVEEIFDKVKQKVSLKNLDFFVQVTTLSGRKVTLDNQVDIDDIVQEERINYPDNCQTLDVTKNSQIEMEGVKNIKFRFMSIPVNISVYVDLVGKSSACSRNLAEFAFFHSGDKIVVGNFLDNKYAIKIFGEKFVEEDPGNDCRNYPNDDFLSYKDCDQDYMKKEVDRISPGLNPVWLSDHLSHATPKRILQNYIGKFIRASKWLI